MMKKRRRTTGKRDHAFRVCQRKITAHKLDMRLVSAEYAFDGGKILFSSLPTAVDFRELVKDLASVFRTRIECGKSACGTRQKWWAAWESAADPLLLRRIFRRLSARLH